MSRFFTLMALILCYFTPVYSQAEKTPPPIPVEEKDPSYYRNLPPEFVEELKGYETQGDDRFLREFLNMLFILGMIVGLILIATWYLKRMVNTRIQQQNVTSTIKILEKRSLTPKSTIYLLDVFGKGLLVADSANGVTNLGEVPIDASIQDLETQESFTKILKERSQKKQ